MSYAASLFATAAGPSLAAISDASILQNGIRHIAASDLADLSDPYASPQAAAHTSPPAFIVLSTSASTLRLNEPAQLTYGGTTRPVVIKSLNQTADPYLYRLTLTYATRSHA